MLQISFIDVVYKIIWLSRIIWNNKNNDIKQTRLIIKRKNKFSSDVIPTSLCELGVFQLHLNIVLIDLVFV